MHQVPDFGGVFGQLRSVRNDSTEVAADLCDREMELLVLPELVLAAAHCSVDS